MCQCVIISCCSHLSFSSETNVPHLQSGIKRIKGKMYFSDTNLSLICYLRLLYACPQMYFQEMSLICNAFVERFEK